MGIYLYALRFCITSFCVIYGVITVVTNTHACLPRVAENNTSAWSSQEVDSSWNVMAHGDAREGKWRGNWRMEWVTSTLHTTSEHGVSSITTADAHTWAASSRLNWRPCRFKWTRPFRRKTKTGFCACAIIFQLASTYLCFSGYVIAANIAGNCYQ